MIRLHSEAPSPQWGPHIGDEALIPTAALRAQYLGRCSEMHLWRLLNDDRYKPLAFPTPIKINGRNYWRLGEIREWIRAQEAKSRAPAPTAVPPAEAHQRGERRRKHR